MGSQDGVATTQRKTRKRSKVVEAKSKERPQPKRRKKAGSLAQLPNMPLDILFEIFGQLPPYDLLKLTRTSKAFRRLLLNKSSITIWKMALNGVPELPPCPPEMSEPAWTNLVFSPHCHFCLTYTRSVFWFLRIRSCAHCAEVHLEDVDQFFIRLTESTSKSNYLHHLVGLLPTEPGKRDSSVCNPKSLVELGDKYLAVPEDNRGAFLEEQRRIAKKRCDHGELCESWAKRQIENRELELRQLRADRLAAVVSKLVELGWGDDIRALPPAALAKHKLVDRPQRLTEKIWYNIKDVVLAFMEDMRTERLREEFEQLVRQRKRPAVEFLKAFKKSKLHEGQLMPEGPDFCDLDPVKEVLRQPVGVDVDVSSFDVVFPQLPAVLARWREVLHKSLLSLLPETEIPELALEPSLSVAQRLELATTIFRCGRCTFTPDDFICKSSLLFYPQVLGHQCLTRIYWDFEFELDYSVNLIPDIDNSAIRRCWSATSLSMNHAARKIAKEFVELAGLDPSIATVKDMDQLDFRFVCRICADSLIIELGDLDFERLGLKPVVSLWTWRAVIKHHYDNHSPAFEDISESYEVIKELPGDVKSEELRDQELGLTLWSCLHCSDTPSEMRASLLGTKEHLAEFHDIESPTINEDYFKVFAADDIEATRNPFWVCSQEGSISPLPEELSAMIAEG